MIITVPFIDSKKQFKRKFWGFALFEAKGYKDAEIIGKAILEKMPSLAKNLEKELLKVMPEGEEPFHSCELLAFDNPTEKQNSNITLH